MEGRINYAGDNSTRDGASQWGYGRILALRSYRVKAQFGSLAVAIAHQPETLDAQTAELRPGVQQATVQRVIMAGKGRTFFSYACAARDNQPSEGGEAECGVALAGHQFEHFVSEHGGFERVRDHREGEAKDGDGEEAEKREAFHGFFHDLAAYA